MNEIEECIRRLNGLLCDRALKDVEASYVKLVRFENGSVEVVNMPICRTDNILAVMPVSLIGKLHPGRIDIPVKIPESLLEHPTVYGNFQYANERSHPGRCYPMESPIGKIPKNV
jgi:hypothetical protein